MNDSNFENNKKVVYYQSPYGTVSALVDDKGCVEIKVAQHESAFYLTKFFPFQKGSYTIKIFEPHRPLNFICPYYEETSIPNRYFGNTDTNRARMINNREPARWRVIQKEMKENDIKEIIIKLCPTNQNENTMQNNCLENKVALANGKLKPTILRAILNIYKAGKNVMTAREVKNECRKIDRNVNWDGRVPAICNAMRNAIECDGKIVGADTDSNEFTISFEGAHIDDKKSDNETISKLEAARNTPIRDSKEKTIIDDTPKTNSDGLKLNDSLNWDKLCAKGTNKLLIIGCSDSKVDGGNNNLEKDYFNNPNIYNNLLQDREMRTNRYSRLIEDKPNSFNKKRDNRGNVTAAYFHDCLVNQLYLPAYRRYTGRFYNNRLQDLYIQKNKESNLHILIISGLYGVIEFTDSIIDYHLEINKMPLWTHHNNTTLCDAVEKYIAEKSIDDDMVFYSLSNSYKLALKPCKEWKNLWITVGGLASLSYSANFIENNFLPNL